MHTTTGSHRSPARRALALAAVVALPALGLAACGDDDGDDAATEEPTATDTDATDTDAGAASIAAEDISFSEVPASVAAGAEVTFDNRDSAPHTVTADGDEFDTGTVEAGSTDTFTAPDEAGTYTFHCEIHPSMTATLTVE